MNLYFIDLDGTIEDSRQDMAHCVNQVRRQMGLQELHLDNILPHVNKGMTELYRACFADFLSTVEEKNVEHTKFLLVKNHYEEVYFSHCCIFTKCYEGVENALELLSKSGKIIVVTNKPEKISRQLLKLLNLEKFITDVMGGDSCSECKPSPVPLIIAAQKQQYIRNQHASFMIGDSLADMQAAKSFGAKAVWCAWGYSSEVPTVKPDIILSTPNELVRLLN